MRETVAASKYQWHVKGGRNGRKTAKSMALRQKADGEKRDGVMHLVIGEKAASGYGRQKKATM